MGKASENKREGVDESPSRCVKRLPTSYARVRSPPFREQKPREKKQKNELSLSLPLLRCFPAGWIVLHTLETKNDLPVVRSLLIELPSRMWLSLAVLRQGGEEARMIHVCLVSSTILFNFLLLAVCLCVRSSSLTRRPGKLLLDSTNLRNLPLCQASSPDTYAHTLHVTCPCAKLSPVTNKPASRSLAPIIEGYQTEQANPTYMK